jgi:hypothetical protein
MLDGQWQATHHHIGRSPWAGIHPVDMYFFMQMCTFLFEG